MHTEPSEPVMRAPIEVEDLTGVTPSNAMLYLRATGWSDTESRGSTALWTRRVGDSSVRVLLPLSNELLDFAARMYELLSTVATVEQRTREEVLYDLRFPLLDVQHIRTTGPTPSGTTGLRDGYLAIKGVHDLFLSAATSASLDEPVLVLQGTKPDAAKEFLNTVRLGPTGRGSFVLKVETPLDSSGGSRFRETLRYLYRAVSSAHLAATESIRADSLTVFEDQIASGVTANLCSALADIGGPNKRAFDMSFAWAKVMPVQEPTPALRFSGQQIDVLRNADRYLRKLVTTSEAVVRGTVTNLKRKAAGRVGGRVIIEGTLRINGQVQEQQKVSAQLSYEHYEMALEAHRDNLPLVVTGRLRQTSGTPEIVTVTQVAVAQ